jgi:hypothetical protein
MRFKAIFLTLFLCTAVFSPKFNPVFRFVPEQLRCRGARAFCLPGLPLMWMIPAGECAANRRKNV